MGPRAAMNPSGAPMTMNSTHAVRRARARFGSLRLGPLGSVQSGRGRFRELAIRTRKTAKDIDKDDGESIRNDKQCLAERPSGPKFQGKTQNSVSSRRRGEKTKPFAVISSHS